MAFSVNTTNGPRYSLLRVYGDLSGSTVKDVKAALSDAEAAHRNIVIDLENATHLDSLCLGVLLGTHNRLAEVKGGLHLVSVPPDIYRTLQMSDAARLIPLYATREQADLHIGIGVEKEERGKYFLFRIRGEFRVSLLKALREAVENALAIGHRHLVFDLSATTRIDSVGIGLLANLHKRLSETDGEVILVDVPPAVRDPMRTSGILRLMKLCRTVEEAEDHIG